MGKPTAPISKKIGSDRPRPRPLHSREVASSVPADAIEGELVRSLDCGVVEVMRRTP